MVNLVEGKIPSLTFGMTFKTDKLGVRKRIA